MLAKIQIVINATSLHVGLHTKNITFFRRCHFKYKLSITVLTVPSNECQDGMVIESQNKAVVQVEEALI